MNTTKAWSKLGLLIFLWKSIYLASLLIINNGVKLSLEEHAADLLIGIIGAALFVYLDNKNA